MVSFYPIVFILIGLNPHWIWSLQLTGTLIPQFVTLGGETSLECWFQLGNGTQLYSVKWYKDGHEFYRYRPRYQPQIVIFPLDGINVNTAKSYLGKVHLQKVTLQSQGAYRCEVSLDAPSFQTRDEEKYMKILVLPRYGPKITGVYPWYTLGDNFIANCNVDQTFPEPNLHWLVNNLKMEKTDCGCVTIGPTTSAIEELEPTGSIYTGDDLNIPQERLPLYNSSTELRLPMDGSYIRDGSLNVECRVTFPNSTVILQDIVVSNIKTGLGGVQYADLLSGAMSPVVNIWEYFPYLLFTFCLCFHCLN